MNSLNKSRLLTAMLVVLVNGLVAGCGGNSSPAAATTATASLNGIAATGAAISGAAVTAKCVAGTASGTTAADGSFKLVLDNGQTTPCILQVTKAGSPAVTLYSYASAAGRVNITPLTDMVLAKALADSPAAAFTNFDVAHQTAITNGLAAAKTYVQAQMVSGGVGTPTIDFLSGTFAIGDANDHILDVLGTALSAAGKTLADLRATAAIGGTVFTVPLTTTTTVLSGTTTSAAGGTTTVITTTTTTNASVAASELTIAAGLTAMTVGTHDVSDASVLAGLAGSHTFGRGIRGEHNHASFTPPAPALISGCTVSIAGNNLILAAAGQQVSVSLTPTHYNVASFVIQNITAQVLPLTDLTSRIILNVGTTSGDSVSLTIIDGFVSQVTSVDNARNIYTECGSRTGGNQNTDRSADVLTLPATFISSLVASASPPLSYVRDVTNADLVGVAATIQFGRGTYSTYNNDANHSTKTATLVDDCQVSISNGTMRLSSVAARFDRTFTIYKLGYNPGSSADISMLSKDPNGVTLQGQFRMDLRTGTPVPYFANGGDFTAGILSCPLQ